MSHGGRRRTKSDQVPVLMRQAKQRRRLKKTANRIRRVGLFAGRVGRAATGGKLPTKIGQSIKRKARRRTKRKKR